MQDLQWESTGRRLAVSFRSPFCREINVAVVLLVLFYFRMEQCYLQLRFFPFGPNFASDVFYHHFFQTFMASCSFDTLSLQLIRSFKVKKVKFHPKIYKTANVNGKSLMIIKKGGNLLP